MTGPFEVSSVVGFGGSHLTERRLAACYTVVGSDSLTQCRARTLCRSLAGNGFVALRKGR